MRCVQLLNKKTNTTEHGNDDVNTEGNDDVKNTHSIDTSSRMLLITHGDFDVFFVRTKIFCRTRSSWSGRMLTIQMSSATSVRSVTPEMMRRPHDLLLS